jgi:hypothetical protein
MILNNELPEMREKLWPVLRYYPITFQEGMRSCNLGEILKVAVAYFKTISRNLSGGIEKNTKHLSQDCRRQV